MERKGVFGLDAENEKRHLEVWGCVVCCFYVFLRDVDCFLECCCLLIRLCWVVCKGLLDD